MLVLRRDFTPGIPWPGYLDLPGGAREGCETPEACALRETWEELGLSLPKGQAKVVCTRHKPGGPDWFFVLQVPERLRHQVRFGDEGLGWTAIQPADFVNRSDAVPHFRGIVARYLRGKRTGRDAGTGPVRQGGTVRGTS